MMACLNSCPCQAVIVMELFLCVPRMAKMSPKATSAKQCGIHRKPLGQHYCQVLPGLLPLLGQNLFADE